MTSGFQAAVDLLSPLALFQFSAVTRGKDSPSKESKYCLTLHFVLYMFHGARVSDVFIQSLYLLF